MKYAFWSLGLLLCAIAQSWLAPAFADDFVLPRAKIVTSSDCNDVCPVMVTLPSGLRMSQTQITRAQYGFFIHETNYQQQDWGCRWNYPGIAQTDKDPVVCLNLPDVEAYLKWLSAKAGVTYRLPTVAEYRYAAMAGEDGPYWWGQSIGEGRANCLACGSAFDTKGTSPVGSFEPNPFGLEDVVGNAWQWTATAVNNGADHYLIGGSWASPPADLRVSRAIWNSPKIRFNTYGLRVVTDPQ